MSNKQTMSERTTLRNILKKFNVSLIMILPLFWRITQSVKSRREGVVYPFVQLAFEYGLLNTFLYKESKFDGNLYLLFDREKFIKNIGITNSLYFSICELVVDSPYYNRMEIYNDYILIGLKIPDEYLTDIPIVESGLYSKLSPEYKDELFIRKKVQSVPVSRSGYGTYILCNDLAYAISVKDLYIKEELDDIIGTNLNPKTAEFYSKFDEEKENFVPSIVSSSKELLKLFDEVH
jgi:hypothetical protein